MRFIDKKKQVDISTSDLRKLAEDYLRFTKKFLPLIQRSAMHIYHSALPLSPKPSSLYPMTLCDETLLTYFNGRPETWGTVIQTIRSDSRRFTCMATFGHWIAVACSDGLVRIYDVVTGSMRLSLMPLESVKVVRGSPDGSILFCSDQETRMSIWDIQTGGLIHPFAGKRVTDIAVSSKGHYLLCLFPKGIAKVWGVAREVVKSVEGAPILKISSVDHFCWLEPEEQLIITRGSSVQIWDVVAGTILRSFTVAASISGVVYSQELNRLAATSILWDTIIIIDLQTGISSVLPGLPGTLSCFAFSPTIEELVCGMYGGGLEVFNFSTGRWRHLEYPRTPGFLFSAPNGTVVVGSINSGIQVLSLDEEHAPSPSLVSGLSVSTLDQSRIIMITPTVWHRAHLLETSTLAQLLTISAPETLDKVLTSTVSASLENRMTVYCLQRGREIRLQLHRFGDRLPKWTRGMHSEPSVIAISPSGTRLVTSHGTCISMWDTGNGQLQAELSIDHFPFDITFDSETRFHSYHHGHYYSSSHRAASYRIPFDLNFSPGTSTTCTIIGHKQQPWTVESGERKYQVEGSREWVVMGSKRVFWIPPGCINSNPNSHCWAGSNTLVMIGEDEVTRTLTFRS